MGAALFHDTPSFQGTLDTHPKEEVSQASSSSSSDKQQSKPLFGKDIRSCTNPFVVITPENTKQASVSSYSFKVSADRAASFWDQEKSRSSDPNNHWHCPPDMPQFNIGSSGPAAIRSRKLSKPAPGAKTPVPLFSFEPQNPSTIKHQQDNMPNIM